jgi:hypothetical protein
MLERLARFRAKRTPVRVKKARQNKKLERPCAWHLTQARSFHDWKTELAIA